MTGPNGAGPNMMSPPSQMVNSGRASNGPGPSPGAAQGVIPQGAATAMRPGFYYLSSLFLWQKLFHIASFHVLQVTIQECILLALIHPCPSNSSTV